MKRYFIYCSLLLVLAVVVHSITAERIQVKATTSQGLNKNEDELDEKTARIISKQRYGYLLQIYDRIL